MSAAHLLEDLTRRGATLWAEDGRVRCRGPKSVVTPEVVAQLKESKADLLRTLSDPEHSLDCQCPDCSACAPRYAKIRNAGEVLDMARSYFGVIEDPLTPPEPLVQREDYGGKSGDRVRFFKGDWREAEPRDFTVHRPDGAA